MENFDVVNLWYFGHCSGGWSFGPPPSFSFSASSLLLRPGGPVQKRFVFLCRLASLLNRLFRFPFCPLHLSSKPDAMVLVFVFRASFPPRTGCALGAVSIVLELSPRDLIATGACLCCGVCRTIVRASSGGFFLLSVVGGFGVRFLVPFSFSFGLLPKCPPQPGRRGPHRVSCCVMSASQNTLFEAVQAVSIPKCWVQGRSAPHSQKCRCRCVNA